MPENIRIEHDFTTNVEQLWQIVGTPDNVSWVPGVESCTFDGEIRRFVMSGAGDLAERIIERDDAKRLLRYGVIESSPPLAEHAAAIEVISTDSGARLIWTTRVSPGAVAPFIEQRMHQSLAQLERVLQG